MRVFIVTLALVCALSGAIAQQPESTSDQPQEKEKKARKNPETKTQEKKATPAAEKTPEASSPGEEPKAASPKPGTDKDKEEFDVAEVAPLVTHHQVTVDGKLLKYTATTGRLPIKRGDGKIEAEMFFVAYTLEGQDAGKRPLTFAFNGGPGSTRATWCWWMRSQPASAAPPTPSCPRNSWESKAISKRSANSSGCISRATSAGVRRSFFLAKATEPRVRPASRGIWPIRAFPSMASPCFRRRSASRPWKIPRVTTSLTSC